MKKRWKIGLGVIAAVVVLYALAAILFNTVLDPNAYKSQLTQTLTKEFGRQITIKGKMRVALFPTPGLEVKHISIGNDPSFQSKAKMKDFVDIHKAVIHFSFFKLIFGSINPTRVIINKANINLVTNAKGQTNWPVMSTKAGSGETPVFHLEHSQIHWIDERTGHKALLQNLNVRFQVLNSTGSVSIKSEFYYSSPNPKVRLQMELRATGTRDATTHTYTFDHAHIRSRIFTIKKELKHPATFKAQADISANFKDGWARIQNVRMNIADLTLTGDLIGNKIFTKGLWEGDVKIAPFNPKRFLERFEIKVNGNKKGAWSRFSANFPFQISPRYIKLTKLTVNLDQTRIAGTASMARFNGATWKFNFSANRLNLDRYNGEHISDKRKKGEDAMQSMLDVPWGGTLQLGALTFKGLVYNNVRVNVKNKAGVLNVSQIRANYKKSSITGSLKLNHARKTPVIAMTINTKSIPVATFTKELGGKPILTGGLNLNARLQTIGWDKDSWLRNLSGSGSFAINNGNILGVNFDGYMKKGLHLLKQKRDPYKSPSSRTPFSRISASFTISRGVMRSKNMKLTSPLILASGTGQVRLTDKSIRARIMASYVGPAAIKIPLLITGTLHKPKVGVDLRGIGAILLKRGIPGHIGDTIKDIFDLGKHKKPAQ